MGGAGAGSGGNTGVGSRVGNDNRYHRWKGSHTVARNELRPITKLRSTANTGYTYVTRKNRRNHPDRLALRKFDPVVGHHVEFREER